MKYFSLLAALAIAFTMNSVANAQQTRAIGGGQINPQEQIENAQEKRIPTAGTTQPPQIDTEIIGGNEIAPPIDQGRVDGADLPLDQALLQENKDGFVGKPQANLLVKNNQAFTCDKLGCRAKIVPGEGLEILDVHGRGIAARLGLQEGDCIQRINGVLVNSFRRYNTCLLDAGRLHDGWLTMRVKDIRYAQGYDVNEFVRVRAYLGDLGGLHGNSCTTVREPVILHTPQIYHQPIYNYHQPRYHGGGSCNSRRHRH